MATIETVNSNVEILIDQVARLTEVMTVGLADMQAKLEYGLDEIKEMNRQNAEINRQNAETARQNAEVAKQQAATVQHLAETVKRQTETVDRLLLRLDQQAAER